MKHPLRAIADKGGSAVDAGPSFRARILGWLARRFGPSLVLPLIAAAEAKDHSAYSDQPEAVAAGLPADEQSHSRIIRTAMANFALLDSYEALRAAHRDVLTAA